MTFVVRSTVAAGVTPAKALVKKSHLPAAEL